MAMRTITPRLLSLLLFAVFVVANTTGQAPATTVTYQIDGLTAETRDGITRDLASTGGIQLVYACVPAGILVFQDDRPTPTALVDRLRPILEHRIARQRIRTSRATIGQLEQLCAEQRNP